MKFLVQCLSGAQWMWAFVTIIVSQITFPLFWNISPAAFSSPSYQAVSFCVSADQPDGRRHGCRAGQASGSEDEGTPWMKVHRGQQYLSPVSSAFPGWRIGVSPPRPHRRPSLYLSVLVRPSLPVGHSDLFILFLSSPVPTSLLWVFWYGQPSENIYCWY